MKRITYISLFTLLVVFSSSCSGYLDKYPIDKPASSTFLKSEVELDLAVVGAYQRLWNGYGGYSLPFEIMLDCTTDIAWERADASWQELGMVKLIRIIGLLAICGRACTTVFSDAILSFKM